MPQSCWPTSVALALDRRVDVAEDLPVPVVGRVRVEHEHEVVETGHQRRATIATGRGRAASQRGFLGRVEGAVGERREAGRGPLRGRAHRVRAARVRPRGAGGHSARRLAGGGGRGGGGSVGSARPGRAAASAHEPAAAAFAASAQGGVGASPVTSRSPLIAALLARRRPAPARHRAHPRSRARIQLRSLKYFVLVVPVAGTAARKKRRTGSLGQACEPNSPPPS